MPAKNMFAGGVDARGKELWLCVRYRNDQYEN